MNGDNYRLRISSILGSCVLIFLLSFFFLFFFSSPKDLENLKAEVQRRQQLQELGKSEEPAEDRSLELEDKIPID